jgi:hypothetical protein
MRNSGSLTFGISLVIIGILVFLNTIHIIDLSWNLIWPIFILGFGIMLHLQFMIGSKKNPGILVPAGIITTYGLLFYTCILLGWHMMNFLWPLFIMLQFRCGLKKSTLKKVLFTIRPLLKL